MKQESAQHGDHAPARFIALPVAHMLGLAPLDVWIRMLARSGRVRPRYWARLAFILFTSAAGTITTAHERLLTRIVWRMKFGDRTEIDHEPGVVVILGYYRSGTTHLQNLMSCDQRFVTPRWRQALAGQGFWLGWTMIRFILVPFLGGTRPQDAVGFGPDWPGEDDFALCTWGGASSLPGRFVWPSGWDRWKRWHALEGLSDKELVRWRRLTAAFVWKITRGARNRRRIVLLKSPSHTARVAELDRLCKGRIRFVHLVRDPGAVIDSNVRLAHSLSAHLLEDAPDVQTIRDRIVEEYAQTEAKCHIELGAIDPERVARVRYQDLKADGLGTLASIYAGLGLEWNQRVESAARDYLQRVGQYTPARAAHDLGEVGEREREIRAEMTARSGLDAPGIEPVPVGEAPTQLARFARGAWAAPGIMGLCWLFWLGLVWGQHAIDHDLRPRMVLLVWPLGAAIGWGTRRLSGRGTRGLGIWCAALTLIMAITVLFPISVINWNWAAGDGTRAWLYHNTKSAYEGLASVSSVVLVVLGALTAWRHASADGPRAPGT